jgi:hypothetical protein
MMEHTLGSVAQVPLLVEGMVGMAS